MAAPEAAHVSPENKPPRGLGACASTGASCVEDRHAQHVVDAMHKLWPRAWGAHIQLRCSHCSQKAPRHALPHDYRHLPLTRWE